MLADELQARVPPIIKWGLAGGGGVAGWHYAQQNHSAIPLSCVVAGAAAGFCVLALSFAGLRILRAAVFVAIVLFVINYAVLIPFGYGDHLQRWLQAGRAVFGWFQTRDWPRAAFW